MKTKGGVPARASGLTAVDYGLLATLIGMAMMAVVSVVEHSATRAPPETSAVSR